MNAPPVFARFVYGLDTPENRANFEAHIRTKGEEADRLGLKIGSREHHDFVFGSYVRQPACAF